MIEDVANLDALKRKSIRTVIDETLRDFMLNMDPEAKPLLLLSEVKNQILEPHREDDPYNVKEIVEVLLDLSQMYTESRQEAIALTMSVIHRRMMEIRIEIQRNSSMKRKERMKSKGILEQ
jgi:hypothetical protein